MDANLGRFFWKLETRNSKLAFTPAASPSPASPHPPASTTSHSPAIATPAKSLSLAPLAFRARTPPPAPSASSHSAAMPLAPPAATTTSHDAKQPPQKPPSPPDASAHEQSRLPSTAHSAMPSASPSNRGPATTLLATRPEARCANVSFSPEEIVSIRLHSASSAASLTSAGTTGVRATCIRSKVYNWRTSGRETCRGVLGCSTSASFTLRCLRTLLFFPNRSSTSAGKSGRRSKARAASSDKPVLAALAEGSLGL
jgi:hypothetical protein